MNSTFKNTLYLSLLLIGFTNFAGFAQAVQPDAIYLDQVKEFTLNADGSWDYHYSHKLKLLTYYSFQSLYGEDFILFNPSFQKLKVNHSITTMAVGTIISSPDNAYNEVLPGFAANSPAYNHLREMVVTHTGLERDATEDFDYTITTSGIINPAFTGNEVLLMNSPIEKLTFIINIPSKVPLNYSQYNIKAQPSVTKSGSRLTYQWVLTNLPAVAHEDFRPKELQNRPRIVFSTAKTPSKLLESFLNQDAFQLNCDPKIVKLVNAVRNDRKTDLAVMLRLQDIVANEVNFNAVPLPLAGYRTRNCNETFQSNGGTELEKSVLLASMLNVAGFKAFPVAILADRYYDKKSFNLNLIEKFLVKAMNSSGETFYLSPLQNDLQDELFILAGKTIIPLIPGKSIQADKEKSIPGEIESNCDFTLNKKMELKGNVILSLSNRLNPFLKLVQDASYTQKLLNGMFEPSAINLFSIDRMDSDHSSVHFGVSSGDFTREQAGHYFLKFPGLASGIDGWHITELVSTRIEPVDLPFPIKESYRYTITLPEGYELITEECSISLKEEFGTLKIQISQEGKTLFINRMINITTTELQPAEYATFKAFINTWNNRKYREAILRIGPK